MENPINVIKTFMQKNSNPMISNLMEMANSGNNKGIEQFARNICKQKGIDYDTAFPEFMKNFKG